MPDLSLNIHLIAWLIVGASVGLFALAGTAIDKLRPVRATAKTRIHHKSTTRN